MTRPGTKNIIVREARVDDRTGLLAMVRHFLEQSAYGQVLAIDAVNLINLTEALVGRDAGLVLVAEDTQYHQLVAMIAGYTLPHPAAESLRVFDELVWWVEPDYRRTRLGPFLLAQAEAWARQKGVHLFKMVAPAESPKVAAYYQAAGYQALETAYFKRLS